MRVQNLTPGPSPLLGSLSDSFNGVRGWDRLRTSFNNQEERCPMSLQALYHWQAGVRHTIGFLGCWQVLGLALYSYGVVLARQCAPSRVAESEL